MFFFVQGEDAVIVIAEFIVAVVLTTKLSVFNIIPKPPSLVGVVCDVVDFSLTRLYLRFFGVRGSFCEIEVGAEREESTSLFRFFVSESFLFLFNEPFGRPLLFPELF